MEENGMAGQLADALNKMLKLYQNTGDHTTRTLGTHGRREDCIACEAHRTLATYKNSHTRKG